MPTRRSSTLGPASRPVAVPEDLDLVAGGRVDGRVELPLHVRWSGPVVTYDLAGRPDRCRVYEQVLREGTDDDVRRFVDLDDLLEMYDQLVLAPTVRRTWVDWFGRHQGVDLDPVRGPEADKRRPAIIVSNDGATSTAQRLGRSASTVVPVSARTDRAYPFQVLLPAGETDVGSTRERWPDRSGPWPSSASERRSARCHRT